MLAKYTFDFPAALLIAWSKEITIFKIIGIIKPPYSGVPALLLEMRIFPFAYVH